MLSSTGVKPSTSASGSQPSGNTKKDKIQQTPSSTQKNKVEAHPRKVKSSLKNKDCVVEPKGTAHVQHSKLNANSELKCVKCNGCMLSDNHDLCVLDFINNVNARTKSKSVKKHSKRKVWKPTGKVFTNIGYIWRPTGRTFTIVGNVCPLTRITTTTEVPLRKSKTNVPIGQSKVLKSVSANKKEPSQSWGSIVFDVPSSSLYECTVKFENDHVAKILGYGDYQIGNVTILRVYYVERLGHNLFFVGQFCDSNLEVAFRQHTCFIRNLEGVDLLTGSQGNNLYTLSLGDMMASSPIRLLSKASKTKSWLWHRRMSHLNFSVINHLARHGLVRGLPKLKIEKDHLCSACSMGKSKKKPHKPKSEDTNQENSNFCTWIFVDQCVSQVLMERNFNELTAMASEHSSSGPALHEMTHATISLGLVPNPPPSTLFVPPSRTNWDLLFQPLFDELLTPPPSVDCPNPKVIAPIAEVVAPEPAVSTGLPSSTTVDQDAPSPNVAHMNNDPFFGIPIPENNSEASSSNVIPTVVHTATPNSEHVTKWTKDHPLNTHIAMQEGLNEFERLEVWELVPRPDKVMVITLKWIYKVKLDELGGILKNKARLVARGYRQEEGIDFEESFAPVAR
ncbi:retrovirus-related pol polyprotein from transposon TNT 1-94 [Tanacetum coccineum]